MGKINTQRIVSTVFILMLLVVLVGGNVAAQKDSIDLNFQSVELRDAFRALADVANMNIVTDSSVQGTTSVHLEDISFREAVDLLAKSSGLDYRIVNNTVLVASSEKLSEGFGKKSTKVYKLKNADPGEVKESINLLVEDDSIRVDKRTNSLIITAYQSKFAEIEDTIKELDYEKKQIIIQARVEEITHGGLEELGVDWNFQKLDINGNSATIDDREDDNNEVTSDSNTSTISDNLNLNYLNIINMLESKNQAKNLANPQITTLDGKQAAIDIGDEVPIVKPGGDGQTEVEFRDVGINLDITPKITEEGKIQMDVKPQTSVVSETFETNDGIRYPTIETRKVETNVRVADGKTIAIGGLIREEEIENMKKVPGLGNVPILGKLFQSKSMDTEKTELVVFLTPKIIDSTAAEDNVGDNVDAESGSKTFNYEIGENKSVWNVGKLFNISFAKILDYNDIQYVKDLSRGQTIKIPVPEDRYYEVKDGDSLSKLSKEYDVKAETIQKINGISSLEDKVGEEIVLPVKVN
ncbi:MAG: LysM peptidoglycan-binding domain-containing protein [Bacillota bacterium]